MSSSNKVTLAKLCKQHYHVLPIANYRPRYLLSRCLSSVFTKIFARKAKQFVAFGLLLLVGALTTPVSAQTVVNICDRTAVVETAILAAIPVPPACTAVTATQLAAITELDLSNMSITALQSGDFADLTGLTTLRLQGNTFTTALPANLFDDLPSVGVIEIDLAPVGDLTDIALTIGGTTTINIANAFISKDATGTDRDLSFSTTLSGTSATATVNEGVVTITASSTITGDTDVSITANDGTNDVIRTISVTVMDICSRTAQVQAAILAAIPAISDCMDVTATHLAAITSTLNLSNMSIATLQSGDFAGLSGLTSLNLFDNDLTTIEANAFSGLAGLITLSLGGNDLTTIEANAFSDLTGLTALFLGANDLTIIETGTFSGLTSLTTLDLRNNDLTTIEANAFSDLTGLTRLDLVFNDLTTIEANAFSGLTSLTTLDLSSHALTIIEADTFSGLTSLITLSLGGNDLTTIEANAFSDLTSLTTLNLRNNDLTIIEADTFSGLTSLTTLDLVFNDLTTIEANAFSDLAGLTTLDLSSHALTIIEADTFSGLTSLTSLNLFDNDLTTIEANAFSDLTGLTALFLGANDLTIIETGTFSGLTSLTTLDLRNNDLTTIEANAFSDLTGLTRLDLVFNDLTTIEANAFSGLTSLTTLDLSSHALTIIEADTFSGLTSLITLSLGGNDLTTIEANAFSDLTSLTTLNLRNNDLTIIEADTFSGLTSLTTLDLVFNDLTTIEANAFSDLAGLTTLDLSSHALTIIEADTFSGLTSLTSLNLFDNDLTTIEANAFSDLTGLTALFLGANDLTIIETGTFSGLTSLTTLDLRNNDLTTIEANAFSDLTGLTRLDLVFNDLTTIEANAFSGLTSLTTLDLSSHALTIIEADTFSGLTSLITLSLGGNDLTTIEANAFSDLTGLTRLHLAGNPITTPLPTDIFNPVSSADIIIDLSPIGDLPGVALSVGGTTTINVANAFISKDLDGNDRTITYTVTPANTAVATAIESSGVVTITGAGAGATTVSVLADDGIFGTRGMFTRDIAVTVEETGILAFDEATGDTLATPVAAENGGTDTFYVELASAPASDVTLTLTSSDTNEGTVMPGTLTFTATPGATSWDSRQAVTVTAVDDNVVRDDSFTVDFVITTGSGAYDPATLTLPSVTVTITDDDTAGIDGYDALTAGDEVDAITTSEAGDAVTTYVELTSEPTGTVTVTIDGIDTGEHTLTAPVSGTLTFDSTNWNTPRQAITITGVDDNIVDGDQTYTLTLTATGGGYDGVVETGLVTNTDDDTAELTIADTTVDEDAGTATVTVTLSPMVTATGDITVDATTMDGTATAAGIDYTAFTSETLTFAMGETSKTLDIPINDDIIVEGDETFTVMLDNLVTPTGVTTVSITDDTATVTITDNETAPTAITLSVNPPTVAETAGATEITITATIDGTAVLPTETVVTVSVGGGTATSGTDYTAVPDFTLTIPAESPSGMATFMIDPTDDATDDNDEVVTISGTASGFTTVNPATLTIVEAGILVYEALTGGTSITTATIAEASGSDILYVQLASQPATSSSVVIGVTSSDTNEGTVNMAALTFTDTTWMTRQALTVTTVPDEIDRDDSFMVNFAVTTGDGVNYDPTTLTLPSVTVLVTDDDTVSNTINLSISQPSIAETAGATDITVTATLGSAVVSSMPTTVTVSVGGGSGTATSGTDYAAVTDFTLTIPALSASATQTFMITPVDDSMSDNNETVEISGTATGFTTITPATLTIVEAGISVYEAMTGGTPINTVTIAETSTDTLYVQLASQPASDITLSVTSSATDEGTVDTAALTFTNTNWNTRRAVIVTAVDDNIVRDDSFTVDFEVTTDDSGAGGNYTAGSLPSVTVTVTDDDTAPTGITLSIDPSNVAETAGATTITVTATIDGTVVLSTATDVTVSVGGGTATGSGTDYADVTDFTLTIPALSASATQTFMITPVDDSMSDNNETVEISGTATGFTTINPATLTIVEAGISVYEAMTGGTPINTVTIAETSTDTLYVQLASQPASDITLSVTSSATDEGTVDTAALTFTNTNWNTRRAVIVTAVDDNIVRDDSFTVDFEVTTDDSGAGGNYTAGSLPSVTVTVTDDDTAPTGITLSIDPSNVAETAGATTITVTATLDGTVVLPTTIDVMVTISDGTAIGGSTDYMATPSTLTITIPAEAGSATQTFMIDTEDDGTGDNNETVTISGTATINGMTATITPATLTIVEAGISVYEAMTAGNQISTATIAEASSDILYVQLASEPATGSSVVIGVTSSDTREGTVSPGTLTFTDTNWETRQALTVTAVPDNVDRDGDSFMVDFAVTAGDSGAGGNYTSSLMLPSVAVTVSDDDTPSDTINLSISPPTVAETAGATTITVTAALGGALSTMPTEVTVTVGGGTDMNEATVTTDYTLSIPTATLTLTIPALMTSGNEVFTITPIADNENDNEETITISGTATGFSTVNAATLTITGFSREEQQVIEQTVAAQASSVTQVVSENIGSFLASRTSAPPAAPAPPAPDGGGGGDVKRENLTSIDWQDWQDRFAKLAYEGLKRLDSDADMSLDWALKAAGGDGRLLMPLSVESLTLWAAGGRLKTKGDGMGEYDGGVNSFVVGVDTNLINNWLLGIAASYSDSQVDYTMDGAPIGSNEQNLFSVHPFLSHSLPEHGLTLWVTGGYGVGDIDFSHTTNGEATSDVTQWMAAGGVEKQIITRPPWQGALRIKGLWGNAEVDATEYDNGVEIRKVESTFWRARMESEMGYHFPIRGGGSIRPYALIGGRWDHNDAIVSGDEWHIDIGGGVEVLSDNAFALNISVHTQVTDGDTEEDSIIGTGSLTYDLGHDRQGLQITLSRPLNNTSPAWDQHSFNEVTDKVSGINSAPLTSELAYGWTVRPFGLKGALQTYIQNSFDNDDRHYAVGLELVANALTLNFETGYGEAENTGLESMLKTKIRW